MEVFVSFIQTVGAEVNPLETLSTFIQTVAAQVVAYYLCTWIDGKIGKGSKH